MTKPTRFIDKNEFDRLTRDEWGTTDMLEKRQLKPFAFVPPHPADEPQEADPFEHIEPVNILVLDVIEPVLFRHEEWNESFVILPSFKPENEYTFDDFADLHYLKSDDIWGYEYSVVGSKTKSWVQYRPVEIAPLVIGDESTY